MTCVTMHWLFEHRIPQTPNINDIKKNPERAISWVFIYSYIDKFKLNADFRHKKSLKN